jgi:hypothetical protein
VKEGKNINWISAIQQIQQDYTDSRKHRTPGCEIAQCDAHQYNWSSASRGPVGCERLPRKRAALENEMARVRAYWLARIPVYESYSQGVSSSVQPEMTPWTRREGEAFD